MICHKKGVSTYMDSDLTLDFIIIVVLIIANGLFSMTELAIVNAKKRKLEEMAEAGNERAKLAIEMQRYEILKFVGSYIAAMNGVDAIAFTGGIGENDPELRRYVCENLTFIGAKIDNEKNQSRGKEVKISTPDSKVDIFVIPTNEELAIARDTLAIISK